MDWSFSTVSHSESRIPAEHFAVVNYPSLTDLTGYWGPAPIAKDGFGPAQQETPVTISELSALSLQVTEENTAPVITGQSPEVIIIPEDQVLTITPDNLLVTDPDDAYPADFTITLTGGTNYSVSGLAITPATDFSGDLFVPVTVNDGEANSQPYNLRISVTAVNDRPRITGQQPDPLTTGHNQPLSIAVANLVITDPDHTEFSLTVQSGENYTITGDNTITPAPGFSGQLAVSVTVSDGLESSDPYALKVDVAANAAPVITGQTPMITNEEMPITVTLSNLTVSDPDNSYPTGFTLRLLPGENYIVSGETISPASNFEGDLVVPVIVNDGTSDSPPYDLHITVQGVNDKPLITGQVALSVPENQSIALELSHLTVEDPDNAYPSGFTLSVLGGDNYSVAGNVITPASGFNGVLTVRVFVNDGTEDSETFDLAISVTPINDPPAITGQRTLEIPEGSSIILSLDDITVEDPDNSFPEDFTMALQPGENYTFSGTTVTPLPDFNGTLSVSVVVNDGTANSEPYLLQISVVPVNDAPQITGQRKLTTPEDVPITIVVSDLLVSDPDNTDLTLVVFSGDNYTLSGNTILPVQDYSGALTVPLQVSDGELTSNVFELKLEVTPVNDLPVITGQTPVETDEDTPVTIQLSHLTVLDVDNSYPSGFMLLVSSGANYSVSGSTVTPFTDFNGTLNVSVMVNDGTDNSAPFTFQVQVGRTNDAPVVTGQATLSTDEEKPVTIKLSHLTVYDPDNTYPTGFSLLISPGPNYTVSGETITPAVNFAGTLTIPVRVNDGINNSPSFDFQLQVNQINDPPSFGPIANLKVVENAPAGSLTIKDISKGPMEETQQLTFVATSSNTAIIEDPVIRYNGTATTAALSYVVKPNVSGVVTITVAAIDNGSNVAPHQNSYSSSFQIEVMEINSAPTLDAINNITLLEDAEQQNVTLTGISAGPGETQVLAVSVSTNKPEYFDLLQVAYTSPETTGLLQFKPKQDVFGTAQLSVAVADNGSGVSPHVNRVTRVFSVIIQPVNDPPFFTSKPVVVAVVNEQYVYNVTAIDQDGERITISAPSKPAWASLSAGSDGKATLQGKPGPGAVGDTSAKLQAKDAASTVEQFFSIYVNMRPAITSLSMSTAEDATAMIPATFFQSGYTDANDDPLNAIKITALPASGKLLLSGTGVKSGDTISVSALSGLNYTPNENFFGMDSFGWNAFDGYHFSSVPARVDVSILSINDAPAVVLEDDTLHYEVNGEPDFISPLADIFDPDDDTLARAVVGFHPRTYSPQIPRTYSPQMDWLEFENTANIRGNFDFQSGLLQLTGTAPLAEYRMALRSVRYLHRNTIDPLLEPKTLFFTVHDGETESAPKEKVIKLQYTFVELEIPSGFTPNGDQANDTWIIGRPGGGLDEMDNAIISVYNKQGVLVFRTKGFDRPWDGTMNGELLPADSYFFTIDLQLRNKKTYKGIVTILR